MWIANSIVHSILLYWLTMFSYGDGIVWSNGKSSDYLVVGNMVYTYVVVTVCCKAGLEMDTWSWISHLSIWGSIGLWFAFLIVYSYVWVVGIPLAPNMAGMIELLFSTPFFWLCLLLVPFTTLIPDIAYKALRVTVRTTETDKIRIAEIMRRDVSAYVESAGTSRPRPTEQSSLIRNVKKVFTRRAASSRASSAQIAGSARSAASTGGRHEDMELQTGYAFSQEEGGAVSQVEYIRRYDTTKPRMNSDKSGGT
jgi:phospholipid-transporting ATPase